MARIFIFGPSEAINSGDTMARVEFQQPKKVLDTSKLMSITEIEIII
jgi:hypothetical protein